MSMATVLAGMPDLRRRFLDEHAPDARGRCRECHNGSSPVRDRPCLPYRIACEAQRIADGGLPGARVPAQVRSSPTSPVPATAAHTPRRLRAVPAASWQPHW